MRNSITSTAQMIEKMKSVADEKTKRFQEYMNAKWFEATYAERELCAAAFWQGLFNLQLEMLKAAEAEEAAADRFPAYGGRDRGEMEADAVKADEPVIGDIKGARDNPDAVAVCKTNFYHYPADISDAKMGDIWLDLDGRPHFILGDGWIEARGFTPSMYKGQKTQVSDLDGRPAIHWSKDQQENQQNVCKRWPNLIARFKLT